MENFRALFGVVWFASIWRCKHKQKNTNKTILIAMGIETAIHILWAIIF